MTHVRPRQVSQALNEIISPIVGPDGDVMASSFLRIAQLLREQEASGGAKLRYEDHLIEPVLVVSAVSVLKVSSRRVFA
jgi:hypothetical protein